MPTFAALSTKSPGSHDDPNAFLAGPPSAQKIILAEKDNTVFQRGRKRLERGERTVQDHVQHV